MDIRIESGMAETVKETTKVKKEPKVEIFGESVDSHDVDNDYEDRFHFHHHHHHHHHGSLAWGLALVLVGVLFLLSNFGALPPIVLTQILHLWPMLIILIGLDVLIGHSEVSDIVNSLIGLAIFATILGIIFIHTAPQIVFGLPHNIQNYLYTINNYLQIR